MPRLLNCTTTMEVGFQRDRWPLKLAFCLGVCAVTGCRIGPHTTALPNDDEVVRGQLVFHADFELPSDHRLVQAVLAERDDVSRILDLPETEEPIHVYLFRDEPHYADFVRKYYPDVPERRAFFLETDTRLAVYAHWNDRIAEDLRHEVAHGYLHAAVPNLPLWLDEGLAEFFEVPRGHDGLNRPHLEMLVNLIQEQEWQPDLDHLAQLQEVSELTQREYAEAWAWVHFLLQTTAERRELLQSYLSELRRAGNAEPLDQQLQRAHVQPGATLAEYLLELGDS